MKIRKDDIFRFSHERRMKRPPGPVAFGSAGPRTCWRAAYSVRLKWRWGED